MFQHMYACLCFLFVCWKAPPAWANVLACSINNNIQKHLDGCSTHVDFRQVRLSVSALSNTFSAISVQMHFINRTAPAALNRKYNNQICFAPHLFTILFSSIYVLA